MERKEFIFNKDFSRTHSFCTFMPETFVLIQAEGLKEKKYKVFGGTYTENNSREVKAISDFELFIPQPNEKLVSFELPHSGDLKAQFFVGPLQDLFLAEFFLSNNLFNRSGFNYVKRELTYSENDGRTFVGLYGVDGSYKLSIATSLPFRIRQDIHYKRGTNAYKLIEWFFQQMKVNPPDVRGQSYFSLDKLLAKYFPALPYKEPQAIQGVYYR